MASMGRIRAKEIAIGVNDNTDLTVDATGQVQFKIGNPTAVAAGTFPDLADTAYATTTGTGISTATKQSDAVQLINNWINTYLIDTPPAPTVVTATANTEYIYVQFTNPTQKNSGITAQKLPLITQVKADIVRSSLNGSHLWNDGSTVTLTLETISSGSPTVTELRCYIDTTKTNGLSAGIYSAYTPGSVLTETEYDIRVYAVNNSSATRKYLCAYNLKTLPVGTPSNPRAPSATPSSSTAVSTSWTVPDDRDLNTAGLQTVTPYITTYKVSRVSTSSVRYGGPITDTADTFTTTTSGSDSATSLSVTALHPGTLYTFTVYAKNSVNASYGTVSSSFTATTSYPLTTYLPNYLTTGACATLANVATLRGTYPSSSCYSLAGVILSAPVISSSILTDSNGATITADNIRINVTEGDVSTTIGTAYAYGGLNTAYTTGSNTASRAIGGFGQTVSNGNYASSSTAVRLVIGDERDFNSGNATDYQGFYKSMDISAQAYTVASQFPPSIDLYSLAVAYAPVGGSTVTTNACSFYVDAANATTVVSNPAIISASSADMQNISGVPTFKSTVTFTMQWNQSNVAYYFLRNDRKHADVIVTTSGGTLLTATYSILSTLFGASHKYYTTGSNTYQTSATLHNGAGTALAASSTPEVIQMNDFTLALTLGSSIFDEGLLVKVTPFNMYNSTTTQVSGSYTSPTTGTSKAIRLDSKSITADISNITPSTAARLVTSGTGTYPAISSGNCGDTYNHATSILTNADLQLVNGRFETKAVGSGYKDYSSAYYYPGSFVGYNYSTIASDASIRWVTYKFQPISSGTTDRLRITLTGTSGLSVNYAAYNAANYYCYVKCTGSLGCGWLDANNAVLPLGISTASTDGTYCANLSTSTTTQKDVYIPPGSSTDLTVYVRIGLVMNVSQYVTSATCVGIGAFA
jgi:hypothetical protein